MKSPHTLAWVLVLTIACSASVRAETDPAVIARLDRIEKTLAALEARLGDKVSADELAPALKEFSELNRQLGYDGKPMTVVKAAGKEPKLSIGGFVQAQAEAGGAPDSRYTGIFNRILLRRARLTVKSTFNENFDFTLQSDFGNNSIGGTAGYRAQLTDAFVAWTKYPEATVQFGQFKTPFGYEQLLSDPKTLTIERSLPNDSLTVSRQLGVSVSGVVADKRVNYSVGAFNGNGVNNGNNDNDQFMYAGRVSATAWSKGANKLSVAANGFWTRDTGTLTGWRTGLGIDSQLTVGAWDFAGEYLHVLSNRVTGTDTSADGWYVLGAYYFVPKTLQGVVRFEDYDSNVDLPNTTSRSWVFGLNYYIKGDDLKLLFNYTLGKPAGLSTSDGRLIGRVQVIF